MPGMELHATLMAETWKRVYLMEEFAAGSFSVPDFLQTFSDMLSAI
jgi:hypothetical protein